MANTQVKNQEQKQEQDQVQEQEQLPVQYGVRIHSLGTDGSILANASVNINGVFAIRGVKVMSSTKGPFVSLPSYRSSGGEYRDICFPCTKEARQDFDNAVMGAYQQALSHVQGQHQASAPDPFQEPGQSQTM